MMKSNRVLGVLGAFAASGLQVINEHGQTLRLNNFRKRTNSPEQTAELLQNAQAKRDRKNLKRRRDDLECKFNNCCLPSGQEY